MNNPFRVSVSRTPLDHTKPGENVDPVMGVWAAGPVSNAVAGSINRKRSKRSVQKHPQQDNSLRSAEETFEIPAGHMSEFSVQQSVGSGSTEVLSELMPNVHHGVNVDRGSSQPSFRITSEGLASIHKYSSLEVPPLSRFSFPSLVPPTLQSPITLYHRWASPNTSVPSSLPVTLNPEKSQVPSDSNESIDIDIDYITTPSTLTAISTSSVNSLLHTHILSPLVVEPTMSQSRRSEQSDKQQQIVSVLRSLQKAKMTTLDLLLEIHGQPLDLDETENEPLRTDLKRFRQGFFSNQGPAKFRQLLTTIWESKEGREVMEGWMDEHAVKYVCEIVSEEIEAAKKPLFIEMHDVTATYVKDWGVHSIMDPVIDKYTPLWFKILTAATTPNPRSGTGGETAKKKNEDYRDRAMSRAIITSQVIYTRSQASALVQVGLGLLNWTCGASRKVIEILHRCGLSPSYPSISKILDNLADSCVKEAGKVARMPHMFCYDNINVETSIHIEQTSSTPNKVQSGSFSIVYPLYNATPENISLAPILERIRVSKPLLITDLRPSLEGATSYIANTTANITKILAKYVKEFAYLKDDPILRNLPRRPLPRNLKTKFYPLRATTIEEATVQGNLMIHDDAYEVQLKFTEAELNTSEAILSINDQLTNSRVRSAQVARALDLSIWDRRDRFMLAFGLFHLIMNMLWAILNAHRGRLRDHGSLNHLFTIIEKARLGSERPDYYTLLAALTQVLHGLILNAWRTEYGDLKKFGLTKPLPEEILMKARVILHKYCMPTHVQQPKSKSKSKKSSIEGDTNPISSTDITHSNVVLLIRDLLYVMELISAVTDGDFGRIEDILPDVACLFRGAGSNNYSMEVLHILHNFKEEWTPEFSDIVRDNMLINPSGLEGHFMPVDLNIEHNIGFLKGLFADKGVRANWDRLGNISASINHLQDIKKQAFVSLHTSYQGSTHTEAKTDDLVWRVANAARDSNLQVKVPGRRDVKASPNLCAQGHAKFESGSLASFNEKIENMKAGKQSPLEDDDLPPMQITLLAVDLDEAMDLDSMEMDNLNDID